MGEGDRDWEEMLRRLTQESFAPDLTAPRLFDCYHYQKHTNKNIIFLKHFSGPKANWDMNSFKRILCVQCE